MSARAAGTGLEATLPGDPVCAEPPPETATPGRRHQCRVVAGDPPRPLVRHDDERTPVLAWRSRQSRGPRRTMASTPARLNRLPCRPGMKGIAVKWLHCGLLALAGVASAQPAEGRNPLLTESTLPYHLPPFAAIKDEHSCPRSSRAWRRTSQEVEAIAGNPAAPTFDNTIVALERGGALLDRVATVFGILTGAYTNPQSSTCSRRRCRPACRPPRRDLSQLALSSARPRNSTKTRDKLGLDAESLRLLERYHLDFVRAGASSPRPKTGRPQGEECRARDALHLQAEPPQGNQRLRGPRRQRAKSSPASAMPRSPPPPVPRKPPATKASTSCA